MTKITFIEAGGTERVVAATAGRSLMETALNAGVKGILAECNGAAACATCHIVLPQALFDALPAPGDHESDMLDFADAPREPCSRLSCQIQISPLLDGATIRVPTAD